MTDNLKTSLSPISVTMWTWFGSSASKGVCISIKEPTKLGSAGTSPPWGGRLAEPLKTSPISICVTTSSLVILHQRVYAKIEGNPKKLGSAGSRLLGVDAWLTP